MGALAPPAARFPRSRADTPLVVVAAHPDDETLGAGGLLARTARAGLDVDVVVATDGEASHPDSPTYSPADLARWRAKEVEQAVALLAPDAHLHLLAPAGRRARPPRRRRWRERIEPLVGNGFRVVAPLRGDAHPDHETAGRVAARVAAKRGAELLEYPVWAWHWSRPGDVRLPWPRAVRLPLDADAAWRQVSSPARAPLAGRAALGRSRATRCC